MRIRQKSSFWAEPNQELHIHFQYLDDIFEPANTEDQLPSQGDILQRDCVFQSMMEQDKILNHNFFDINFGTKIKVFFIIYVYMKPTNTYAYSV